MSQLIQSGGVQTETQLNQIVYLDFDGAETQYNNRDLDLDIDEGDLSDEELREAGRNAGKQLGKSAREFAIKLGAGMEGFAEEFEKEMEEVMEELEN